MTRPRPAVLVLGIGAIALVAGTVGIATAGSGMHVESVGSRPSITSEQGGSAQGNSAQGSSAQGSSPQDSESQAATVTSPYRSLDRRDATQLPRPDRSPRPVLLTIPSLDLTSPVDIVGLDDRNQVEVPEDVSRAGWYRFSSRPGSDGGSTVIVAHRDGIGQGAGAFYDLGRVRLGDIVRLITADGTRMAYEVVARESFAKQRVPLDELFSRSGPSRLTLITCGGAFDPGALSYTDNIVVTALPITKDAALEVTP